MAIKELQTRIALKYDSYENWKDSELVLLPGEIGLCEIPGTTKTVVENGKSVQVTTAPTVLFKVGNKDKTPFKDLPWASAKAADVYGWAKAATVEVSKIDGKEYLVFKDAAGVEIADSRVDLSRFALAADVKTTTDDLAARLAIVEGKFSGDASVEGQIAGLDARLDVIESTDETKVGSIAKALKDAKDYADSLAGNYDAEGSAAAAEQNAKDYADGLDEAMGDRVDDVAADLSAHEAKKDNPHEVTAEQVGLGKVENKTVAEIKAEFTGAVAADNAGFVTGGAVHTAVEAAKTAANNHANGLNTAMGTRVDALEAAKTEQATTNANLAKAIEDEATARGTAITNATNAITSAYEAADLAINNKIGAVTEGKTVVEMISAAQTAAEGKVTELAEGAVADNAAAISAMDAAYKKAVEDEAKARADEDAALDARLDKVETFFEGAYTEDGQPVKEALDTLVEIQNFITGEGEAASDLIKSIEANATAIDALEKTLAEGGDFDKRVDAIEADVSANAGNITTLQSDVQKAQGDATQAIADALAASNKVDTKAAEIKTAYEAYADGKASAAQTAAEETAAAALSKAVGTLNASIAEKVATADFNNYKTEVSTNYETKAVVSGIETRLATAEGTIKTQGETKLDASTFTTFKTSTYDVDIKALQDKDAELIAEDGRLAGLITDITKDGGKIDAAVQALVDGAVKDNADAIADLEDAIAALDDTYVSETEFTAFKTANTETINGVNTIATNAGAAASAVASRVDAYDTYFGVVDGAFPTTLIFNCGSATDVIESN